MKKFFIKALLYKSGFRNIADLTPKKVLVSTGKRKPFMQTVYFNPHKTKEDKSTIRKIDKELIEAVRNNNIEGVNRLIKNGANINAKDSEGNTPLINALRKPGMVSHLLKLGADPSIKGKRGMIPAKLAFLNIDRDDKLKETYKIIKNHTTKQLFRSIFEGDITKAEKAIESGADINKENEDGITPLMQAVMVDNQDMVDLLLSNNAKVDYKNKYDKTAIDVAEDYGRDSILKLFKENKR